MIENWCDTLIVWFFSGLSAFLTYVFLTLRLHRYGYSWKEITKNKE